ncbi:MAG: TonB-dependent receptor [Bacteroidales bacterium]
MMRRFISLVFICIALKINAQEPQYLIKGKVLDAKTGETIAGVEIIAGSKTLATSDADGNFVVVADSSVITLTFRYLGYISNDLKINCKDRETFILIKLEPFENQLNEVVVSAGKTEQRASDLTVSMSIIKPLEITKTHIVGAEELINRVQGVEVMDGQASIRGGSGFSYGAGSRVLALVDGLPAISADAGNVKWQYLPIENLEQIEVLKGASSVLYGSSALNGIINFRTAAADTIPVTRFSVSSGMFDQTLNKNWIWWINPRFYSDASFSFAKRIKNTEINLAGNYLSDNGYRKLNDENSGRLNLKIKQHSFKYKNLEYGIGLNGGLDNKTDFILWENADSGALKQNPETATNLHGYNFSVDPFIKMGKAEVAQHEIKARFMVSENRFPENSQNNSQYISNYSEYRFFKIFRNLLDLNAGFVHDFKKINSNFYGDHQGNNLAAYTQADLNIYRKIKFSAGLRLEFNELDGNTDNLVPVFRTGINYHAAPYTFIRASFGQGYRYPSVAEKYAFTTLGAVRIYPNPEVRSESGWTSEIGIKQGIRFGKLGGQADLSIFYSHNSDMIEYIFGLYSDPLTQVVDFGFRASNLENSRVYGAETELMFTGYIGKIRTAFGGGYTYIYPVELDKATNQSTEIWLKYRRKHAAKVNLSFSYKKFELGMVMFYKSKILNIDDVFLNPMTRESLLPGFYDYWQTHNTGSFVADGYISCLITQNLKFSIAVKNFTNTEYMGRPGDIQPQRFFSLQLSGVF